MKRGGCRTITKDGVLGLVACRLCAFRVGIGRQVDNSRERDGLFVLFFLRGFFFLSIVYIANGQNQTPHVTEYHDVLSFEFSLAHFEV